MNPRRSKVSCHLRFALIVTLISVSTFALASEWPTNRNGLVFAFPDGTVPTYFQGNDGSARLGWQFTPKGYGHLRSDGALVLGHGGFAAEQGGEALAALLLGSEHVTLSIGIHPGRRPTDGPLFTASAGRETWLRIVQAGEALEAVWTTPSGEERIDAGTVHDSAGTDLAIVLLGGQLTTYRDGVLVKTADVTDTATIPEDVKLYLGDLSPEASGWAGAVDAVCIYERALPPNEIGALHRQAKALRAARLKIGAIRVRATLEEKSTVLTPQDLTPYTQGLTVYRYTVDEVLDGHYEGDQLHVAHWTVLDRKPIPFVNVPEGTKLELTLELYDENPQLASENLSDDVVLDFSIPYYYDAGGRALQDSATGAPR